MCRVCTRSDQRRAPAEHAKGAANGNAKYNKRGVNGCAEAGGTEDQMTMQLTQCHTHCTKSSHERNSLSITTTWSAGGTITKVSSSLSSIKSVFLKNTRPKQHCEARKFKNILIYEHKVGRVTQMASTAHPSERGVDVVPASEPGGLLARAARCLVTHYLSMRGQKCDCGGPQLR